MGNIYIASKPVALGQEHLYIVYDEDGIFNNGDETVIRGGPQYDPDKQPVEWALYTWGDVVLEIDADLSGSEDNFLNKDETISTPSDRNFTKLTLPAGMSAEGVWASWISLANGVQAAQHDYDLASDVMTNSNRLN